jgi:hypothetical protein
MPLPATSGAIKFMTVSEIAELLKPYGSKEYSFYEYLNQSEYGATSMADS